MGDDTMDHSRYVREELECGGLDIIELVAEASHNISIIWVNHVRMVFSVVKTDVLIIKPKYALNKYLYVLQYGGCDLVIPIA